MPIGFRLTERVVGFAMNAASHGEQLRACHRGLLGPDDPGLPRQLDELHRSVLGHIPGMPDPTQIGRLVVLLDHDLIGTAYVNDLQMRATIRANRPVNAGDEILASDVLDCDTLDLGVEVPTDVGLVVMLSLG